MRHLEITVSLSQKIQIVQFEPTEAFCAVKAELETGDDVRAVGESLAQEALDVVRWALAKAESEQRATP